MGPKSLKTCSDSFLNAAFTGRFNETDVNARDVREAVSFLDIPIPCFILRQFEIAGEFRL
jgi:hypothetical protein